MIRQIQKRRAKSDKVKNRKTNRARNAHTVGLQAADSLSGVDSGSHVDTFTAARIASLKRSETVVNGDESPNDTKDDPKSLSRSNHSDKEGPSLTMEGSEDPLHDESDFLTAHELDEQEVDPQDSLDETGQEDNNPQQSYTFPDIELEDVPPADNDDWLQLAPRGSPRNTKLTVEKPDNDSYMDVADAGHDVTIDTPIHPDEIPMDTSGMHSEPDDLSPEAKDHDGGNISSEPYFPQFVTETVSVCEMLDQQHSFLETRRVSTRYVSRQRTRFSRKINYGGKKVSLENDNVAPQSRPERIRSQWQEYLSTLQRMQPLFFSCAQATMKESTPSTKGKSTYDGLRVHEGNNHDVAQVYDSEYRAKTHAGSSGASYRQFCSAVGQFLRCSVVFGRSNVSMLCEEGESYRTLTNHDVVRAFLNYFDIRASHSSCLTKSLHLKKFMYHARIYFERAQKVEEAGQLQLAQQFVNSTFNSKKTMSRRIAARNKCIENRISVGCVLFPKDFVAILKASKDALEGIRTSFRNDLNGFLRSGCKRAESFAKATRRMCGNNNLIRKWNMNFVVHVLLSAGGQRPQVFPQLLAPDIKEIKNFRTKTAENGYCQLPTGDEKTERSVSMPFVALSAGLADFIVFRAKYILPSLAKKRSGQNAGIVDADTPNGFTELLFLDTRNGMALSTVQVNSCLKRFLSNFDPELKNVTTMSLRASYATMMFRGWLQGKVMEHLDKTQFLDRMGLLMNTSVEQLEATYIAIDSSDYEGTANGMMTSFTKMLEDEDDGANEPAASDSNLDWSVV